MAYVCELDTTHRVYLDNQETQTIVTTSSVLPGQQQQATSSMTTGSWSKPPEAFRTGTGVLFKIATTQGELLIQVQGSQVSVIGQTASGSEMHPMAMVYTSVIPSPSMQPMPPMQPMKMGDMQMTLNPMEMRMGNMAMQMGTLATGETQAAGSRQFCSQCGVKVALGDRFCSSCGHQLR